MAVNQVLLLISVLYLLGTFLGPVQTSTEYNRYLAQIFQKYGNGGTINFEVITNPSNHHRIELAL